MKLPNLEQVSVLNEWVNEIRTIVIVKIVDYRKKIQPPAPVLLNHDVKTFFYSRCIA